MFKQSTVSYISILLIVSIAFWATGVAEASMVSTEKSTPWVPLTDNDMEQVEGGGISLLGWAAIATIVVACITIYNQMKKNNEVVGVNPYPIICADPNGNVLIYNSDIKELTIIINNQCGDPNQPVRYNVRQ